MGVYFDVVCDVVCGLMWYGMLFVCDYWVASKNSYMVRFHNLVSSCSQKYLHVLKQYYIYITASKILVEATLHCAYRFCVVLCISYLRSDYFKDISIYPVCYVPLTIFYSYPSYPRHH